MALTVPTIPPTDLVSSEASLALQHLAARGVLDSSVNTSRWLRELLHMRARGEITLRAAVFIVRWVLTNPRTGNDSFVWSNAAIVEVLGQLDVRFLSPDAIRTLQTDTYGLANSVAARSIRTTSVLSGVMITRRRNALARHAAEITPIADYYDRVVDALAPYVRP